MEVRDQRKDLLRRYGDARRAHDPKVLGTGRGIGEESGDENDDDDDEDLEHGSLRSGVEV